MHTKAVLAVIVLLIRACTTSGPQIVGDPPSTEYVQWLAGLSQRLQNDSVTWDGKITFATMASAGQSHATFQKNLLGHYITVEINQVAINDSLDTGEAILATEKEVVAHYVFYRWWLENQEYLDPENTEMLTLIDGMGYVAIAEKLTHHYEYLISWDGISRPTCDHLQVIRHLHEEGNVNGPGIENLLQREGCQ